MILKRFDDIAKADIDAIVASREQEGRELEYKRELPADTADAKKEFVHDASSFANATGGDLVFGIDENNGVATAALGVTVADADAQILRLESILRDTLDPRVAGIRTKAIPGFPRGPVILMRIPKSWAAPHMVTLGGTCRFFTRNSAGKHQMDVTEIRSAFLLSEGIAGRLRRFRESRLSTIVSGQTSLRVENSPFIVCHLLPFADASIPMPFSPTFAHSLQSRLLPIGNLSASARYNIDGYLLQYAGNVKRKAYCQLFRNGAIETANVQLMDSDPNLIYAAGIEDKIVNALEHYLPVLEKLNVPFPIVFTCSMFGVNGKSIYTGNEIMEYQKPTFDRDTVNLPDVLIENAGVGLPALCRPVFDALWQACGYDASPSYRDNGRWEKG